MTFKNINIHQNKKKCEQANKPTSKQANKQTSEQANKRPELKLLKWNIVATIITQMIKQIL